MPNAVSASCLKAFDVEHPIDTIDEIAEIEAHDLSLVVGIGSQGRSCHKFEEFVVNLDGLHALEFGCFGMDALDAIVARRGHIGEALSDLLLAAPVYLFGLVGKNKVGGRNASAVLEFVGNLMLCGTEVGSIGTIHVTITVSWKFDSVHGQWIVALTPHLAPKACHGLEAFNVFLFATYVRFALVPKESLHGVACQWMEHTVEHHHLAVIVRLVHGRESVRIGEEDLLR